jgi:hypothetical protein
MGKARAEEKGVLLQPYSHLWHTMKPPHILSKIPPALLPPSSQGKISVYFRSRELPPTVMNISHSIFNLPSRKKKKVSRERKRYDNSVDKNIMNPNWT